MRKVVSSGPSDGRHAGSRTMEARLPSMARWNVSATMPGADSVELAAVELGLAEDVEPQRGPGGHGIPFARGEPVEVGAVVALQDLLPGQRRHRDPSRVQQVDHLLTGGEPHHLRAGEVAEGEIRVGVVEVHRGATEGAGREVAQRVDQQGVDAHGAVEPARRHLEVGAAGLPEVVEPPEVGDPVAGQSRVAPQVPAGRREREQQVQRARSRRGTPCSSRRPPAPWSGPAGRPRSENSMGIVGTCSGSAPTSKIFRPFVEHVVEGRLAADPRQVVVPDHPLVVPGHLAASAAEPLGGGHRGGHLVDHAVVEPDHREVGRGHGEVLVVAEVRDERAPLRPGGPDPDRGRSNPSRATRPPTATVRPVFRCRSSA